MENVGCSVIELHKMVKIVDATKGQDRVSKYIW